MADARGEFTEALERHAAAFGARLDAARRERLADYFELATRWNARLHLVAPCAPAEFAVRHVLESLLAAAHLTERALVADVGSGAGLPIIPCMIALPGLRAELVEASRKKAVFLREALHRLGLSGRAEIRAARFEQIGAPAADFVTCRALERFTEKLPELLAWSPPASTLLLFGGPSLRAAIERAARPFEPFLIPQSEQRFLFVVRPA